MPRSDPPPPSSRFIPVVKPKRGPHPMETARSFLEHLGQIARMTASASTAMFRRPLELSSTVYQMDSLGVSSLGIASVTAVFVGMVMAVQFAFGLQKFG